MPDNIFMKVRKRRVLRVVHNSNRSLEIVVSSRGLRFPPSQNRGGWGSQNVVSSLRDSVVVAVLTQDLRPGLSYAAPSGLERHLRCDHRITGDHSSGPASVSDA